MKQEATKWYYKFPSEPYSYGPTTGYYTTEREAREAIREAWEIERLPNYTEVYRA